MEFNKTIRSMVVAFGILILPSWLPKINIFKIFSNVPPAITSTVDSAEIKKTEIVLSAIGDCTLGTDTKFGYPGSFTNIFDKNNKDYNYFFSDVTGILAHDDLTIANLETTFTNSNKKRADRLFNFKGDPSYVNILKEGSVEIVNVANNHAFDYLDKGYNDTLSTLDGADVAYYGNNIFLIKEVKGIKIGFAGFMGFDSIKNICIQIDEAMKYFNDQGVDVKIVSFHWGIEKDYTFNPNQQQIARYSIDHGADLVVGHHPHVLQGIEKYKDKYIIYSLGNFVFGGNKNPYDKDSMICQIKLNFMDNKLIDNSIKIIPVSISSKSNVNDYKPTILVNQEYGRVLKKILRNSQNFEYPNK